MNVLKSNTTYVNRETLLLFFLFLHVSMWLVGDYTFCYTSTRLFSEYRIFPFHPLLTLRETAVKAVSFTWP